MKYWITVGLWVILTGGSMAQDSLTYEEAYMAEYQERIRKSHINGFYIPVDLADAIRILDEIVDEKGKAKFSARPDSVAVNGVFFSFGRWININWGMELGSRLTVSLNDLGVSYPEDMTRLIMYAFHRHLNSQPFEIEELVRMVIEERREREQEAANLARKEP